MRRSEARGTGLHVTGIERLRGLLRLNGSYSRGESEQTAVRDNYGSVGELVDKEGRLLVSG
jgi:hypothetical protein